MRVMVLVRHIAMPLTGRLSFPAWRTKSRIESSAHVTTRDNCIFLRYDFKVEGERSRSQAVVCAENGNMSDTVQLQTVVTGEQ